MSDAAPDETVWEPAFTVDVRRTLQLLRRGTGDPAFRTAADGALWRATRMATGAATVRIVQRGPRRVEAQAWGPGADEALSQLPELLGARDDPSTFDPRIPLVQRAHRRHPGLRVMRTGRVLEALLPAVLEQKVVGSDAFAAWRRLLLRHGDPAPGPTPVPMRVPPSGETWRQIPSWDWHRAGVDPQRARTAVTVASLERQLQQCVDLAPAEAERRLCAVPGVGAWTAAETAQRALGDADAVSVGDYHLAAAIGWTLLGHRIDDAEMLEVLEPWRPHRGRVVMLLHHDGVLTKPRRGPRMPRVDHRRI